MKKLSKIKLNDAAIMSDSEMKYVFGGTGSTTEAECKANSGNDGCEGQGAICKFNEKLKGVCEWSIITGDLGSISVCNCVHHPEY